MKSRDELLDEAEHLEEEGDKIGALTLLRDFADAHPDAIIFCRIGDLAKDLGELEEASSAFGVPFRSISA